MHSPGVLVSFSGAEIRRTVCSHRLSLCPQHDMPRHARHGLPRRPRHACAFFTQRYLPTAWTRRTSLSLCARRVRSHGRPKKWTCIAVHGSSRCVIPLLCQENVAMSAHYGACVNGTSADQLRAQRRTRTAHLQRGPCCSCGRRPRRPTHSVRASGHPWSMTLFVRCVLYHPTCVSTFTLTYGFLHPSISAKIPCRICGRRSMPILNGSDWPCGHLRAFERTTAAITALLCTNHLLQARPAHLYK